MQRISLTVALSTMVYPSMFQSHKGISMGPGTEAAKSEICSGVYSNHDAGISLAKELFKNFREPLVIPNHEDQHAKCALEVINSNQLLTCNGLNIKYPEKDAKIQKILKKLHYFSGRAVYLATGKLSKESLRLPRTTNVKIPGIKCKWSCLCRPQVLSAGGNTDIKGKEVDKQKESVGIENQESGLIEKKEKVRKNTGENKVASAVETAFMNVFKKSVEREQLQLVMGENLRSTGVSIVSGLQELLKSLDFEDPREIKMPLSWQVRCERAVFEVIDYMFKFEVITAEEMEEFFSEEGIRKRTGEHIAKLFPDGLDVHFGTRRYFRPDLNYLAMTMQTKHLHRCLAGLSHFTQKSIIHSAFQASCKISHSLDWWNTISQVSRSIASSMTVDTFLEEVSRWEKAPYILNIEKISGMSFNQLYQNLTEKDEHKTLRLYRINQNEYLLNCLLMDYFVVNLSDLRGLQSFFQGSSTGKRFYDRCQLLAASQTLLSWNERLIALLQLKGQQKVIHFPEVDEKKMKSYVKGVIEHAQTLKARYIATSINSDTFIDEVCEIVDNTILGERNGLSKNPLC